MRFIIAALLLFLSISASAACIESDLRNKAVPTDRYVSCFHQLLNDAGDRERKQAISIAALGFIYDNAATQPNAQLVPVAEDALEELNADKRSRPSDTLSLYAIYLDNNMIDKASALSSKHVEIVMPGTKIADTPAFVSTPNTSAGTADFWRLSDDSKTLVQQHVNLGARNRLIVISSPGCHYCNDAATWITANPQVEALFNKNSIWIDRPDTGFSAKYYQDWNVKYPAIKMSTVTDVKGWPIPAQWATPQFLFVSNGKVVTSVFGWNKNSKQQIFAAFNAMGITTPQLGPDSDPHISTVSDREDEILAKLNVAVAPIQSQEGLQEYLRKHELTDTPIGALSAPARQRFLVDLKFSSKGGLASFYTADLQAELSLSQIYDILSLFGAQKFMQMFAAAKIASDTDRRIASALGVALTVSTRN